MEETGEKLYELAFVLKGQDAEATLMRVLESHRVMFEHKQQPREIKLAYPIKKQKSGLFGWYQFRVAGSEIEPISKALNLIEGVLRFLIVTPPPTVSVRPEVRPAPRPQEPAKPEPQETILSNEALEKKLSEILE